MKFIHRLGFYLGGFAIGLIFLAFFLGGKRASCDYGPQARVKKNITNKVFHYSDDVTKQLQLLKMDTTAFKIALRGGNVNFSKSDTSLDSCKTYIIETKQESTAFDVKIANCDSIAKILTVDIK